MLSDNSNVSLGILDCSLYTRRIALTDDYHKKRMDMLANIAVMFKQLEASKVLYHSRWTKPVHPRKDFQQCSSSSNCYCNECKLCITGPYTENQFWYQKFDLRQLRILRGDQPVVDFDAEDNCRLYLTTIKAMNFQDVIPSIPIANFREHYVLVFDLPSMQDATGNCH